jgi:hypothetical protein
MYKVERCDAMENEYYTVYGDVPSVSFCIVDGEREHRIVRR